jgi:hypothetical protein
MFHSHGTGGIFRCYHTITGSSSEIVRYEQIRPTPNSIYGIGCGENKF